MKINQAQFTALRILAFGATSTSYVDFGAVFELNATDVKILNDTDGDFIISFDDGVTDHEIILAGERLNFDLGNGGLSLQGGTQVQIKRLGANPTTGSIYLSALGAKSSF